MALIAGNWKMNGLMASIAALDALIAAGPVAGAGLLLCPPATLLADFARRAAGSHVMIGAQDCHPAKAGAHTGDISAAMLVDAGASHIIVGHSERRADHGEDDAVVRAKAEAVLEAACVAILCVGETRNEREAGRTIDVLKRQLAGSLPTDIRAGHLIIAYEPVWAIGTGLTPTLDEVAEAHAAIRAATGAAFAILYGGSVKPDNAADLMAVPGVDGALVGGASLNPDDFLAIARAVRGAAR